MVDDHCVVPVVIVGYGWSLPGSVMEGWAGAIGGAGFVRHGLAKGDHPALAVAVRLR
jgi:hypothetical protein